jgi:hemerythrin-like domain-containing protein
VHPLLHRRQLAGPKETIMASDIFERLQADHRKVRQLLEKIEDTSGASEERKVLFGQLAREVKSHAHAEERVFYAALLAESKTRDAAAHAAKEHQEAEEILKELESKDMASSGWLQRFKTLAEELEHHIEEEEGEVFRPARKALSGDRARRMVSAFEKARREEDPAPRSAPARVSAR